MRTTFTTFVAVGLAGLTLAKPVVVRQSCDIPAPACDNPGPDYDYAPVPCFQNTGYCYPTNYYAAQDLGQFTQDANGNIDDQVNPLCQEACDNQMYCQAYTVVENLTPNGLGTATCFFFSSNNVKNLQCANPPSRVLAYYQALDCPAVTTTSSMPVITITVAPTTVATTTTSSSSFIFPTTTTSSSSATTTSSSSTSSTSSTSSSSTSSTTSSASTTPSTTTSSSSSTTKSTRTNTASTTSAFHVPLSKHTTKSMTSTSSLSTSTLTTTSATTTSSSTTTSSATTTSSSSTTSSSTSSSSTSSSSTSSTTTSSSTTSSTMTTTSSSSTTTSATDSSTTTTTSTTSGAPVSPTSPPSDVVVADTNSILEYKNSYTAQAMSASVANCQTEAYGYPVTPVYYPNSYTYIDAINQCAQAASTESYGGAYSFALFHTINGQWTCLPFGQYFYGQETKRVMFNGGYDGPCFQPDNSVDYAYTYEASCNGSPEDCST